VRKFIRATNRALAEVLKPENVEQALDIAMRETGANADRRASLRIQWNDAIPTLQTANSKGQPYGWMSDKDWTTTLDIMREMGTVTTVPEPASLYTNEFLKGP
jgi:NitT/TauT family transport system substrate-binding protein